VHELLARDPPGGVRLEQEGARADEAVHLGELGLDEALAQEEVLRRDVGEAGAALARARAGAQRAAGREQLAVAEAHRQVLVQRVDDRGVRQHVADGAHQVEAEEQAVLDVHDVGLVGAQEVGQVARVELLVARAGQEPVVVGRVGVEEVLAGVAADRLDQRAGVRRAAAGAGRAGPGQQQRLPARGAVAHLLVELEGVGLRAPPP
jgi:hypothetical protein